MYSRLTNQYKTFWVEARFMPESGGSQGGIFHVSIKNSSLKRTRRMAVGVTLASYSPGGARLHSAQAYYESMLQCQLQGDLQPDATEGSDPLCTVRPSLPFVPYAVVRRPYSTCSHAAAQLPNTMPCMHAAP